MELIPQSSLFREHPCHISVLGCKRRAKRGDYDFVSKNKALALNRIVLRMAYINLFSSALPLHTRCWQRDNIEALNVVLSSLRAPRQIVILLILPGPKCVFPEKKKIPSSQNKYTPLPPPQSSSNFEKNWSGTTLGGGKVGNTSSGGFYSRQRASPQDSILPTHGEF